MIRQFVFCEIEQTWITEQGAPRPKRAFLRARIEKNSRVLFSIGIVCPNIEKAREVEKIEFECLGAMQGPVHSKCVRACVHRPLHDPLTLEFNFSNWYCLFYVRKDWASWKQKSRHFSMGAHVHARTWLARILARARAHPHDIGIQFFWLIPPFLC